MSVIPPCFYRVSIKALVYSEQDELLLLQQKEGGQWELPGGGLEHGETFRSALERELQEECGLALQEMNEMPTYVWTKRRIKNNRVEHWLWLAFTVKTAGSIHIPDTEECVDAKFFLPTQLHTLTLHPNIEQILDFIA